MDNLIGQYQQTIGVWSDYNFGRPGDPNYVDTGPAGLAEEVGELCRAWVKRAQGIRGTREEWDAEFRKEAADVFIKLAQVCYGEGFSLQEAIAERWAVVGARDFRANPTGHGMPQEENDEDPIPPHHPIEQQCPDCRPELNFDTHNEGCRRIGNSIYQMGPPWVPFPETEHTATEENSK